MLYISEPERPLSGISSNSKKRIPRQNKRNNAAFKSSADALGLADPSKYDNYRSNSWDSNKLTREELDALQGRSTPNNPFLLGNIVGESSSKSKKLTGASNTRKTEKPSGKETVGSTKEFKKEVEAMTSAVGYKGATKTKAAEVMILNSKQQEPLTKRERQDQQEALKAKVNKLFDMRASDPLIINNLKRTNSVFDKVKLLNENYFNTGRESLRKKRTDAILEVEEEE